MKIECPSFSQIPCVRHSFFASENEALQGAGKEPIPCVTLNQVHGTNVIHVTEPIQGKREGDGLVTAVPGIALGILTADCGPVLFCDPIHKVIGACHAGWRGAHAGILQATLRAMEKLGAERSHIYAVLGPTIDQENYEVGPEFPELIGGVYETYFTSANKPNHHYFNLPLYICNQLKDEGLPHVNDVKCDTYTSHFASWRRFQFQGKTKIDFCNLSAIAIV
jgi:YfiH family protein